MTLLVFPHVGQDNRQRAAEPAQADHPGKLDGLAHVEALLVQRGVDLPSLPKSVRPDAAKRNETARLILGALRDGPKTRQEVIAIFAAAKPDLGHWSCYHRVDNAMAKLRAKGAVCIMRRGVWRLAQ